MVKVLEADKVYVYKANGLTICGKCADDRAWPEDFRGFTFPPLLKTLAGCEYCGQDGLERAKDE